jgi:beta-glucanase (GH16 family)
MMKTIFYGLFLVLALASCNCGNKSGTAAADGYKLVWSDEFDVNGLPDSTKWSYDTRGNESRWGNQEYQWYTEGKKENAFVQDGFLHIVAIKEKIEDRDYSSARLVSSGKGDWLYGRFEVSAKLPGAKGIWPAIWMLSTDWEYGGWPESGEIDIMEHVGYMIDTVVASAHTDAYNHVEGTQKNNTIRVPDLHDNFHVYTLEWGPEEYSAYVDTIKYFTFKNEHKTSKEWPFDKRFHMILNVAVGGTWGAAAGFDSTAYPQEMVVDYVRVYQK